MHLIYIQDTYLIRSNSKTSVRSNVSDVHGFNVVADVVISSVFCCCGLAAVGFRLRLF